MRLSDEQFFCEIIDPSIEAFKTIKWEVETNGDYLKARKLFASYIRETLEPDRYLSIPYSCEDNAFKYPGEEEQAAADRILRLELISTGTPYQFKDTVDWEFNPTENQYKEWIWQLNRHHELRLLAHQYEKTKDEKYAKGFIGLFKSWLDQASVPEQAKPYETKCWRTIEAGLRIYNWMYALNVFVKSSSLDDDTLVDWYKSIWEHGWRLRHFHFTHNWLIMEMNGLCQIGVICPIFKESREWKEYGIKRLTQELSAQVYPDGFQYELATGYHQVVIINYIRVLEVLKSYGESIPEEMLALLEKCADIYLKLVMPNDQIPNLNDGKWGDIGELLEPILPYYPEREDWRSYISKGKEGKVVPYETAVLPYSGFGMLRCEQEGEKYYGLLDTAPYGYAHQHEDKLNFIVNCYGKMLLTEGGNYAYDESEMRKYVLSTRSHNTVRVDGKDQSRGQSYKWEAEHINKPADMTWGVSKSVDWVEGLYDEGYDQDQILDVAHKRKVMLVKEIEGLKPFFIVIDRLYSKDSKRHQYEVLWHLNVKSVKTLPLGVLSLDEDDKNVMIQTAEQPGLKLEVISGQEQPEFQGWLPTGRGLQGEYEPCKTLKYTLDSEEPLRIVTLIYPIRQQECLVAGIAGGSAIDDKEILLILKDGQKIIICEEKEHDNESNIY